MVGLCVFLNENEIVKLGMNYKSISLYKKDVTPLLMHWSYVFLALTHQNISKVCVKPYIFIPTTCAEGCLHV